MDLDKVNSLKEKGNKAYVDGKYDEALDFYQEALESVGLEDSKIAAILHSNIAQAYLKKKDYSLAVNNATESLKLDSSFKKSNLHRAIANTELDNIVDAMKDLRLVFASEPTNETAKDLMRRCSDLPKMKRRLHEAYAKHYMRQLLKKSTAQAKNSQSKEYLNWVQNALLRQSFLSMEGLDITNDFFCKTTVSFTHDQCALLTSFGWIPRQFMRFNYSFSVVAMLLSEKLFKILYHLLRSKTFSLSIICQSSLSDETLLLNKYSKVFLTTEALLPRENIDETDLQTMDYYSDDITNLLYVPGLARFKENRFSKVNTLTFDGKHSISNDFLKLWKKNAWPIKSLSFIYGIPDFQIFKQSKEIVSSKVSNVSIQFPKLSAMSYEALFTELLALKRVFPNMNDMTITHNYKLKALDYPAFVQNMELICKAYETIDMKPTHWSKYRVVIFIGFISKSPAEFKMFCDKYLKQIVGSLRKKQPELKIRLSGPRSYDALWAKPMSAHAVIEFENEAAYFELAYFSVTG